MVADIYIVTQLLFYYYAHFSAFNVFGTITTTFNITFKKFLFTVAMIRIKSEIFQYIVKWLANSK